MGKKIRQQWQNPSTTQREISHSISYNSSKRCMQHEESLHLLWNALQHSCLCVCVWCSAEQTLRLLFLFSSFFPLRKTNLLLHLTTSADFRILLHLFIRHTHSRVGTKVLQQKDKTAFSELVIFIMHSFRFCSFDEWFPFCFSATYFINNNNKKKKHFLSGLSSRTSWQ